VVHLRALPLTAPEGAVCIQGQEVLKGLVTCTTLVAGAPSSSVADAAQFWDEAVGIPVLQAALQAANRGGGGTEGKAGISKAAPSRCAISACSSPHSLEESAARLSSHWCVTVPVVQNPPLEAATTSGCLDWSFYARLSAGATPLSDLVDMSEHALGVALPNLKPSVSHSHNHPQQPQHSSLDWLDGLGSRLQDRVVVPAYNLNRRFVWQGVARVLTSCHPQQESLPQQLGQQAPVEQQPQQQQPSRAVSAEASVTVSATTLTLDDLPVAEYAADRRSTYRQFFQRCVGVSLVVSSPTHYALPPGWT